MTARPRSAGRQVPGHWEGDLVIGKQGKSAMGTLVERVSRFLRPVALPHGHDADSVKDALFDAVKGLPAHLRKSLTWDQGTEMARHAALTLAADLPVYFAHAHSPWERGTNENTNGLIREYFPKGTEITGDMDYLWAVADSLNDRPRAILGFRKPSEVFAELMLQEAEIQTGLNCFDRLRPPLADPRVKATAKAMSGTIRAARALAPGVIGPERVIAFGVSNVAPAGAVVGGASF